jgi:hypothetical protein
VNRLSKRAEGWPAPNGAAEAASVAPVQDCTGALGRLKTSLRRFAVLTRPARSLCWHLPERPSSSFAGLHSLQGTVQEVCNAKYLGAAAHVVVIQRFALDEENAKHITPLSV